MHLGVYEMKQPSAYALCPIQMLFLSSFNSAHSSLAVATF